MENWIDKTMIRAIAVEIFKDFKPSSYEMIKNDYGIYDLTADEENELFGGIMNKDLNNLVPEDFQKGFEDTETSRKNIFLLQLKKEKNLDTVKDLFCRELNEIKKEIKNIKKEEKESCRQNLINFFSCTSRVHQIVICRVHSVVGTLAVTNVSPNWIDVQFAEENSNAMYVIIIFQKALRLYQVMLSIFLYLKSDVKR